MALAAISGEDVPNIGKAFHDADMDISKFPMKDYDRWISRTCYLSHGQILYADADFEHQSENTSS